MTVVLYTQYWIITLSWNHHFCGQQIVLWSWDDLSFVSVKEPWLTVGYISTRGQHILASFNLCPSSRAAQKDTADFCHNTLTRMLPNLFPLIKGTSSVLEMHLDLEMHGQILLLENMVPSDSSLTLNGGELVHLLFLLYGAYEIL